MFKEQLSQMRKNVTQSQIDWETSGDKEKFPHLYIMDKLNDYMWEAMNIPKELLCK
jgi:hypothetical protein